jgi:quinolinate synthase
VVERVVTDLTAEIRALKAERGAAILAHNYQRPEIQDVADVVADSLKMARRATELDAPVLVICGVHFMAETASIANPDKKVLIPDLGAGCSLADTIRPEDVRAWRATHPDGLVVAYVNCSAAVKAEADYCCTSGNAVAVVQALPPDVPVLFVAAGRTRIVSTEQMMQRARTSPARRFVVATETGVLYRLRRENPAKEFHALADSAECRFMKLITLEKLRDSLRDLKHEVTVPAEVAGRARRAIDRMLAIG